MSENTVLGPGALAMRTANTMYLAWETLGMTLPDSALIRAKSAIATQRAFGQIAELVAADLRPARS